MQVGQHRFWIGITAELHHHAHPFAVTFITDIGNATNFSVVDIFSQFFDPAGLTELVRELGHDHSVTPMLSFAGMHFLNMGNATHGNAASAS